MNADAAKFINDIVKPWEVLNADLGRPFSVNPTLSDFTNQANALAVSIKHLPEILGGLMPAPLSKKSLPYAIISDLADSSKHGALDNPKRNCELSVGSMFERNDEAKVRFLRTAISIKHATHGSKDFMNVSMEASQFVAQQLNIRTSWTPKVFNNTGEFSNQIKVHASRQNQIMWTGMQLQIVRLTKDGEYEPVDLHGTVEFTLTSEF